MNEKVCSFCKEVIKEGEHYWAMEIDIAHHHGTQQRGIRVEGRVYMCDKCHDNKFDTITLEQIMQTMADF